MDVYKKIQKELDKGKTVLVDAKYSRNREEDRLRILTKNTAEYNYYIDSFENFNTCCWFNREGMKNYDKLTGVKIIKWQVLD